MVAKNNYAPMIRKITATANDSVLYEAALTEPTSRIVIRHTHNSIKIEYALPEYRVANAVAYQYYLENYDTSWSTPQKQTHKDYTKLGRGIYIFHVRAKNTVDGTISECQIEIEILPAWYESWIAIICYFILGIVALLLLIKLLLIRAQRQLRRERQENERRIKEQQTMFEVEKEKRERELVTLRNSQLEQELQHKAMEMADSTMHLINKNDILKAIDEQMEQLAECVRQDESKVSVTKKISEIRHNIKRNQSDDDMWDKLSQNFNLVHNQFIDKLVARFPILKNSDVKLCVYLKMGLSNKEIASLMNTEVRSVETARYRLRKKLNMNTGDNMFEFLQKIDR